MSSKRGALFEQRGRPLDQRWWRNSADDGIQDDLDRPRLKERHRGGQQKENQPDKKATQFAGKESTQEPHCYLEAATLGILWGRIHQSSLMIISPSPMVCRTAWSITERGVPHV